MEALTTCKTALDAGLIGPEDYEVVKGAWLKSQSLKSAFDAGFMDEADYQRVKVEFLATLGLHLSGGDPAPAPARSAAPPSFRKAPAAAAAAAVSSNGNGHGHAARTSAPAPKAKAAPAAHAPPARDPAPRHSAPPSTRSAAPSAPAPAAPSRPRSGSASGNGSQFHTGKNVPGKSMSGYSVDTGSVDAFSQMKSRSMFSWIMWKVEGSQVIVDRTGTGDYEEFRSSLAESECRYGAFDYALTTSEGRKLNKLVFLLWTPNTASIKDKMMYSSTKDFFKGQLDGLSCSIQADDLDDIRQDDLHQAVISTLTRK